MSVVSRLLVAPPSPLSMLLQGVHDRHVHLSRHKHRECVIGIMCKVSTPYYDDNIELPAAHSVYALIGERQAAFTLHSAQM